MYTFSPNRAIESAKINANFAGLADGTAIASLSPVDTVISNPYKFRAYRTGAQTPGANGKVQFNSENFDTNNNFDTVTNIGRYTIPVSGFYYFCASVGWASTGANVAIGTAIKKNSSTLIAVNRFVGMYAGTYSQEISVSCFAQFSVGDYVEVFEGAGASYAIDNGDTGETYFSGFLVSRI